MSLQDHLHCIGLNHETASVEQREQLAFAESELRETLPNLRETFGNDELVMVSTCNRVEIYGVTSEDSDKWVEKVSDGLSSVRDTSFSLKEVTYCHSGKECVNHLFRVATGLDSMVVGETEIFGQTKAAYALASETGTTGTLLNKLFQSAFSAAKDARTQTAITRGAVSVGTVAVDLAERIYSDMRNVSVMLMGAGEMSERVAKTLVSKGVKQLAVTSRTLERAQALAGELSGKACSWDEWEDELPGMDIIITSTSAPHHLIHKEQMQAAMTKRNYRPLFIIDLAVPRDADPEVATIDSVYLYDIDDLQGIARRNLKERELEIEKCQTLLLQHERRFKEWVEARERFAQNASEETSDSSGRVSSGKTSPA